MYTEIIRDRKTRLVVAYKWLKTIENHLTVGLN